MTDVACVLDCRDKLGEGVIWDAEARCLWWVDVPRPARIQRLNPGTGDHQDWPVPEMVMSLSPRRDGTLLVASHHGLNVFDPRDGSLRRVAAPEADKPANRSNDGGTDARGRFWFGTMGNNIAEDNAYVAPAGGSVGSLYRVGPDMVPVRMDGPVGIANSTCWSPDGRTMYFADTMLGTIYAYDFDAEIGAIWNRRVFTTEGPGYPDGSCVDAEGFLWNARWEGACVLRFAPDGSLDRAFPIPASRVTCCCFGGDDLRTLYVTTSRLHLTPDELARHPQAGGLFALRPGPAGQPPNRFAGQVP